MRIVIPFKTPSINHLYWHRGNIKIMTKEAKELKNKIKEIVDSSLFGISFNNSRLKVTTTIYEKWYCKNGSIARKDISNREKFLIDSVFSALELDDKFIFQEIMIKEDSEKEFAVVEINSI